MSLEKIIELDHKYYMNTFGSRMPVAFDRGQGCTLYDSQGNEYIDFLGGIAVNTLGYNHPVLTQSIIDQAHKILHCSNHFYIESQARLAEKLVENSCGDKVFICNSGAEANEGAIKLARKFFYSQGMHKYEVITTLNSFHGRTLATLAATGQEKYQKPFEPMPTGFVHVPFNDIEAVKKAISDKTCAIMVELIQGEGGVIEADLKYIQELQKVCSKQGILLIFDEVQTGVGRTGKLFAYEHYNVEPDIFTLAKGLGGGIPIGALVAKEGVASAFQPGDHGTTFGGNPLSCTAALTVMSLLIEQGLIEQCNNIGTYFKKRLLELQKLFPFVSEVRGQGLMLGMELAEKISGREIVAIMMKKGFIINCAGHNTLRFVPPLIIKTQEIDKLIEAFKETFSQL